MREVYRRKRETLLPVARAQGLPARGRRRDVLPLARRSDEPSEAFARRLLEHGILVAPGSFFGPAGEGYVRLALVPTQGECERAPPEILEEAL